MSRRPVASTSTRTLARAPSRARESAHAPRVESREAALASSITPRSRRRRRVVLVSVSAGVVAAVVSLGYLGQWLLHQSFFRVHHVSVVGERHETLSQILTTTRLSTHPALLDVNATTLSRELAVYPWIASVSVVKRWPSTVQVTIHEVSAVAVAFDAHHVLRYVGGDGRVLSDAPIGTNLPTLVTTPASLAAKSWPYQGVEAAAAQVAAQLPEAFAAQVRQVIVDAHGNVTLQMTTPLRFFLGPATNLTAKFVAVASALAHATFVAGDLVDVTTPNELSVTGPSSS